MGGGAQAARRERLILTNAGANPVTATVTVLGTTGTLPSIGTNTVTVPPMSRLALLLDALAAGMPRLPLHSVPDAGRPGVFVDCSALVDGAAHRFSWWVPPPAPSPLHHAYTTSLCALAASRIAASFAYC